ncbi:hypothetical protein LZ554_003656 [Drepanopeziza brunnea f. sp. 'monogermtubi']|nr:hypothetical protein LZ554_003656 [Drepanopeziza brunnea f. sp. 'monogermtubi']
MFSTLSRGSSKVRQSYLCSSCLCHIVGHHPQAARPPVDRTTRATSTPFSTYVSLQKDNEPAVSPEGEATPLGDEPEPTHRQIKEGYGGLTDRPISSSKSTLKALRESLIAAGEALPAGSTSGKSQPNKDSSIGSTKTRHTPDSAPKEKHKPAKPTKQISAEVLEEGKKNNLSVKKEGKTKIKGSRSISLNTAASSNAGPHGLNVELKSEDISQVGKGKKKKNKKAASTPLSTEQASPSAEGLTSKVSGSASKSTPRLELPTLTLRKVTLPNGPNNKPVRTWRVTNEDGREYTITRTESTPRSGAQVNKLVPFFAHNPGLAEKPCLNGDLETMSPEDLSALQPHPANGVEDLLSEAEAKTESTQASPATKRSSADTKASAESVDRPPLGPIKATKGLVDEEIKTISADDLHLVPLDSEPLQVPRLSYGLERVLFNPGVYQLQDPRSKVFNFDPYLQTIMPASEFDFDALKQYITSSRDKKLLGKAIAEKKKYTGSTSSMTSALAHFHFLLSQWRAINTRNLSKMFPVPYHTFTALQRGPAAIFLRWRNGAYAIDADKQYDTANILMMLGKSMEKLLTLSTKDFEKYRKSNPGVITDEEKTADDQFHYTGMGDFLMRSQLDAYDPRIPGTGMFDLKTRSVVSVRMDIDDYEEGRGYEIRGLHGKWESFEREYYDMIRSAFLKYSLQVRMGRMDGIFVAYHNTERIFGFQYISLPEMDYALHGTKDTTLGDSEFKLSVELLNRVLERATTKWPEQSLRLHFETRDTQTPFTYVFAEPMVEEEIELIQKTNKAKIDAFEERVLGLATKEVSPEEQLKEWESIRASVEESMEQDEESVILEEDKKELEEILETTGLEEDTLVAENDLIDEDVEETNGELEVEKVDEELAAADAEDSVSALETEEDLESVAFSESEQGAEVFKEPEADSADESSVEEKLDDASETKVDGVDSADELATKPRSKTIKKFSGEIMAMTLTIRNKVNGKYIERPENLTEDDKWEVEYALAEIPGQDRVLSLYKATQMRRMRTLEKSPDRDKTGDYFIEQIRKYNQKGREFRQKMNELEKGKVAQVVDQPIEKVSTTKEVEVEVEETFEQGEAVGQTSQQKESAGEISEQKEVIGETSEQNEDMAETSGQNEDVAGNSDQNEVLEAVVDDSITPEEVKK